MKRFMLRVPFTLPVLLLLSALTLVSASGCNDTNGATNQQPGTVPSGGPAPMPGGPGPAPVPAPATAPAPAPGSVPGDTWGGPSDCGSYAVCGWTPGWHCYNNHNGRSQCCWDAHDSSCRGWDNGGGGSDCGSTQVCGWTPGWHCWNNHRGRPACCWNAYDSGCRGYSPSFGADSL